MDDDLDYNINEPETLNLKSSKEKCSKKLIIIINVIISLVIITALVLIYFFVLKNSGDEKKRIKGKKNITIFLMYRRLLMVKYQIHLKKMDQIIMIP